MSYQPGIHREYVGSNADDIPFPDNHLNGIVSHNSFEHFEGISDLVFLIEAKRLLKTGGGWWVCRLGWRYRRKL